MLVWFAKKVVSLHRKTCKTMYTKPASRTNQQSLFFDLESQLNQKHPL